MNPVTLKTVLTNHILWLDNQDGKQANLQWANLQEAHLQWANLQEAHLQEAHLRGANLQGANLQEAHLRGANLRGADLRGADLRGADLRGADLQEAHLRGADLRGANLRGANLRECIGLPTAPIIPNIDQAILAAVANGCGQLDMDSWHSYDTTHCRAGWAITLAGPAGEELEAKTSSYLAGRLIYEASRPGIPCPDFFATTEKAMADLKRCADEYK